MNIMEVILECPEELSEELSIMVKEKMEKAGLRFYKRVPLKAEPFIGKTWEH
jgi:DNA polymerase I-like protein with 3'-5' exonuclease and polymerase domains